jgi:lipopolysaccharide transport system permease protein
MTISSLSRGEFPSPAASPSQFTLDATRGAPAKARAAFADLRQTAALWRLVWALSLLDIRLRYRGSILGPFWLTLSTGVMVGALGFLYAGLFRQDIQSYLPYLSVSLILWNFLSSITGEGCTCFTQSEAMIRATRMPLSLHASRSVIRNFLAFAHNIVVIVVVFAVLRKTPGPQSYMVLPAFLLWFIDGFAVTLLLGAFGARFRDIPPIIASIMQIAFFVTPILWNPSILEHRGISTVLIQWNPFFALLQIVRGPLLGQTVDLGTWGCALGYSAALIVFSGIIFALARPRLSYWV